ncbi:MAG: hypothetical protein J7K68_02040 [Candidatus Diapherotrites archaeon]|nr:hypothetical protein [Candidatus Diapherotrites archaeon]
MRQWLCLILLLSLVYAGSALSVDDFEILIENGPHKVISGQSIQVITHVHLNKDVDAYNITIGFISDVLTAEPKTRTIDKLDKDTSKITWVLYGPDGTYDLSNAFKIISWDNSVKLELNMSNETKDPKPILSLITDPADLCEKHKFKGFWGEDENCFVKVYVNDTFQGFADENGVYEETLKNLELIPGENVLVIRVEDPGKNTAEGKVVVVYKPPLISMLKEYLVYIVLGFIVLLFVVGAIVFVEMKKKEKEHIASLYEKQKKIAEELERYWQLEARGALTTVDRNMMENAKREMEHIAEELRKKDEKEWIRKGYELIVSLILHKNAFWKQKAMANGYSKEDLKKILALMKKNSDEIVARIEEHVKLKGLREDFEKKEIEERIGLLDDAIHTS